MNIQKFTIRGVTYTVEKDAQGRLKDVRAILTPAQQSILYQQFDLKDYDMRACSSLFTVVTELAKVEVELGRAARKKGAKKDKEIKAEIDGLRARLFCVVELEAMINHPQPNLQMLMQLQTIIAPLIQDNSGLIFKFWQMLAGLINKNPSAEQLQAVFAATDLNSDVMSLGRFIAEYTSLLITQTQAKIYSIRDSRFRDLFMMHPALKALSDAKSNIERVRLSLSGTRHVNTRAPIPPSMLLYTHMSLGGMSVNASDQPVVQDWDRSASAPASAPAPASAGAMSAPDTATDESHAPCSSVSLMPYLKQGDMDIDRILAIAKAVGSRTFKYNKPTAWWAVPLILGTVFELVGTVAIRVPLTVLSLGASLLGRVFSLVGLGWRTQSFDALLSQAHEAISPVKAVKNAKSRGYTITDQEINPLLINSQNRGRSFFSTLMDVFSGDALADKVFNSATTFFSELTYVKPAEFFHLFKTKTARAATLKNIREDFGLHLGRAFSSSSVPVASSARSIGPDRGTDPLDVSIGGASAASGSFSASSVSTRPSVVGADMPDLPVARVSAPTPWKPSDFYSPTGFFVQIAEGLSDTVIDSMFRKSPGAATLYFGVAMASFGTLMAPGVATQLFHARLEYVLKLLPNWMSQHFTGVPAETIQEKVVGVFLQWKALFFGTELALNAAQGDFSLLKDLFSNPEKILMGMVTLIAVGYSLAYIPNIDSPFGAALNFFSNEARKCMNADIGLDGLEYAFLGLKFTLLCSSMVSGKHAPQASEAFDYAALFKALNHQDVMSMNDHMRVPALTQLVQHYAPDLTDAEQEEIVRSLVECINSLKAHRADLSAFVKYFPKPSFSISTSLVKGRRGLLDAEASSEPATAQATQDPMQDRLARNLAMVQSMETSGYQFRSKQEAAIFYDELHQSYREYNKDCKRRGRLHLVVQRDDVLHAFYNKHCYKGSNHLLRIVSLVAFPLTALWRGFKYAVASTETFRSAAVREQVLKSFAKDKAILWEGTAALLRVTRAFTRAMTYAFVRAPLILIATPVLFVSSLVSFIPGCSNAGRVCRDFVHKCIKALRPHGAQLPAAAQVSYAKAIRKADVGHEGLVPSTTRAILQAISPATATTHNLMFDAAIADARSHIGFFNADEKKARLQRVSSVFHDADLDRAEKAQRIRAIVAEDKSLGNDLGGAVEGEFPVSASLVARH